MDILTFSFFRIGMVMVNDPQGGKMRKGKIMNERGHTDLSLWGGEGVSLRQCGFTSPMRICHKKPGTHSSPYWILTEFIPNSLLLRGQMSFHLASMDRDGQMIN